MEARLRADLCPLLSSRPLSRPPDCNRGTGGVPWSVEIGPDGSLFVTLHWSTEGSEEEGEQGPGDIEEDLEDYVVPTLKPVLGARTVRCRQRDHAPRPQTELRKLGSAVTPFCFVAAVFGEDKPPATPLEQSQSGSRAPGLSLLPRADGDAAPSRELLNTGSIFRLKTGRNGVLRGSRRAFCGTNKLNRPAGISFGPDGSVYTTTFASADGRRRIVKFLGAGAGGAAGRFCPDFVCPREEEDFHPWVRFTLPTLSLVWACIDRRGVLAPQFVTEVRCFTSLFAGHRSDHARDGLGGVARQRQDN